MGDFLLIPIKMVMSLKFTMMVILVSINMIRILLIRKHIWLQINLLQIQVQVGVGWE